MPLAQHLIELRKRLTRGALAIIAGTVGGWFLYDLIWPLISNPITQIAAAQGADDQQVAKIALNYTGITGAFDVRLQIAGSVRDASGQPAPSATIVAFPVDRRYWLPSSRRVQLARPDSDSSFAVRDLPAGDYEVALTATDATDASSPVLGPVTVSLSADTSYTAVAHLDEAGDPTVTPFVNDTAPIAAGETT